jgi:CheY-like chemotaxis protein
LVLR